MLNLNNTHPAKKTQLSHFKIIMSRKSRFLAKKWQKTLIVCANSHMSNEK